MTSPKIPKFNEEFDLKLFRFILLKKMPIIILIFIAFFIGAYILLRYTQPVYEAKTVIQVETESRAEKILDIGQISNEQFSQKIELIRSRVFIERVLSKLFLDVRYFSQGKFLNHELYKSSPFSISYVVINPVAYSIPFNISYENDSLFKLKYSFSSNKEEIHREVDLMHGKWIETPEVHLLLHMTNKAADYDILKTQKHFIFEILPTEALYETFISKINLTVLNEFARTIQISVRDKNSLRASDIANKMASEFQLFDIERKSMSANNILVFIESQLENVLNDLTKFEDSITSYKKKKNVDHVQEIRQQNNLTQLNAIENELIILQMEFNTLKNILDQLVTKGTPDAMLLFTILSGSQYQQQLQTDINKLSDLIHKKEQMLTQLPENSSFISSINQQIKAQKNLIIKIIEAIKKNVGTRLQNLTKRYNNQYSLAYVGEREPHFELKRLERLYSISEQFYNQLIERKTEFSILKAGYVPENIILEKAKQFGDKVSPNKEKIFLIAFLLAFFISLFIVVFRYLKFNEIVSASEISKYTSVPVLGVLPKYASIIPIQEFIVEKYPKSILAESLRAVRSNLQFIAGGKGSKVVAITSTISGEGKSFLSINLAGALAITGKNVIIIDVDMRRPTVHKYFDLNNKVGMSTILSGQTTSEECIQEIGKFGIKFITAGPIPPNPAELLNDENFEQLILKLKNEFDYVIIDNPPIGLVSDPLKSMQLADYPIYIIRANYSKRNFLSLPEKILQVYDIKNITIVLNGYDNTVSNVGMEKDIVYAYSYVKGYKNSYYDQDVKPKYTIMKRLIRLFKRDKH